MLADQTKVKVYCTTGIMYVCFVKGLMPYVHWKYLLMQQRRMLKCLLLYKTLLEDLNILSVLVRRFQHMKVSKFYSYVHYSVCKFKVQSHIYILIHTQPFDGHHTDQPELASTPIKNQIILFLPLAYPCLWQLWRSDLIREKMSDVSSTMLPMPSLYHYADTDDDDDDNHYT